MASGLRIRHVDKKNATVIVPHPGGGSVNRLPKEYHIRVDSDGFTIVSPTVWEGLNECAEFGYVHGFVYVNDVAKPPTQGVGFAPPSEEEVGKEIHRVGSTREGSPSYIEKMKREGIIPKGVEPKVTRLKAKPKPESD